MTERAWQREAIAPFAALGLLSVIPVGRRAGTDEAAFPASVKWFPAVGAAMGVVLAASDLGLRTVLSIQTATALELAFLILVSGGMHLDGLADAADGLLPLAAPARRLEIMRSPTLGAFGATAIGLALLVEFASLSGVGAARTAWLVAAPTASRWCMCLVMATFPNVAGRGLGSAFRRGLGPVDLGWSTLIALVVLVPLLGPSTAPLLLTTGVIGLGVGRFSQQRIGGCSGDVYGAAGELAFAAALVLASAQLHA